jgi:hypothetical protein
LKNRKQLQPNTISASPTAIAPTVAARLGRNAQSLSSDIELDASA